MLLFVVSQEDIDLASTEIIRYLHLEDAEIKDHFLLTNKRYSNRMKELAYTRKICKLLFRCKKKDVEAEIKRFNFNKHYKKDFSLRVPQLTRLEVPLGGKIYDRLQNPKTNLKKATTQFELYFSKDEAFMTLLLADVQHDFNARKSHNRPEHHPTALQPKLARAMVNMLGTKGTVYDPMCGAGGILLEAGLMGHKVVGYDIDWKMRNRSRINLKHYGVKDFEVTQRDATRVKHMPYFAMDFPYGKNTHDVNLDLLANAFFKDLKFTRAAVGFPSFYDYKKMLKKYGIIIEKEFTIYLHQKFDRKIVLIRKNA